MKNNCDKNLDINSVYCHNCADFLKCVNLYFNKIYENRSKDIKCYIILNPKNFKICKHEYDPDSGEIICPICNEFMKQFEDNDE